MRKITKYTLMCILVATATLRAAERKTEAAAGAPVITLAAPRPDHVAQGAVLGKALFGGGAAKPDAGSKGVFAELAGTAHAATELINEGRRQAEITGPFMREKGEKLVEATEEEFKKISAEAGHAIRMAGEGARAAGYGAGSGAYQVGHAADQLATAIRELPGNLIAIVTPLATTTLATATGLAGVKALRDGYYTEGIAMVSTGVGGIASAPLIYRSERARRILIGLSIFAACIATALKLQTKLIPIKL